MTRYVQSPGFKEVWDDIGPGFSEDFARWLNELLASPLSQQDESVRPADRTLGRTQTRLLQRNQNEGK